MCQIFLDSSETNFFPPTTPSFLIFWGLPSAWGLRQLPNSPRGRAGPAHIDDLPSHDDLDKHNNQRQRGDSNERAEDRERECV